MELDFEKINKKIKDIDESLAEIRKYASLPDEELWKDKKNVLAIKYLLLQSIEVAAAPRNPFSLQPQNNFVRI